MITLSEFENLWSNAYKALGRQPLERTTIEFMFPMVSRYTAEQIKDALTIHFQKSRLVPTINDIEEILNGSVADNALKAWNIVNKVFDRTGTGETISFYQLPDGAAITYAILTVAPSWAGFGKWDVKDEPFRKQDFLKAYTAAIHQRMPYSEAVPKVLKGHYEVANSKLPDAPRPIVNAIGPQGDVLKQVYRKLPPTHENALQGECGANNHSGEVNFKDMLKLLEGKIFNA